MFKFLRGGLAKRKQVKDGDILCLLRYIFFETETGSCDPVSDYFFVTVLIPVSARILPSSDELPIEILLWTLVTHACRKLLHLLFQAVRAEPFVVLWEWLWVLFRAAQRFRAIRLCPCRWIRCVRADQCCRNTDFQVCSRFSPLSKPNTIPQSVPQVQHFSKRKWLFTKSACFSV